MIRKQLLAFLLLLTVPLAVFAATPQCSVSETFSGTNTQLGRVFRDAIPSSCPGKAYPGIFNPATTYNYETYTYPNTSGSTQCVQINFDPNVGSTPCGTNAHASAYLNSYDPNNQSNGFLGDVGSSITASFSVEIPAANSLVLAITNTETQAICDFSFNVQNVACTAHNHTHVAIPTLSEWGMITLFGLLALGTLLTLRRRQ
jgi:IPTL-CTERM motif